MGGEPVLDGETAPRPGASASQHALGGAVRGGAAEDFVDL